jgi:hypothetical protein
LTRYLRGDFGRKRLGYSPWRHGSETPAVYNRAQSEPRHEDYERREEKMFTHVVSLFLALFLKGLTVYMISTGLQFQEFDFPYCPRANGEDARAIFSNQQIRDLRLFGPVARPMKLSSFPYHPMGARSARLYPTKNTAVIP